MWQLNHELHIMEKSVNTQIKKSREAVNNNKVEKAKCHIIVEIIEYVPGVVVTKTIIKKSSGSISVMSFDTGELLTEKISPFDTNVQVIEGEAEIVIDKKSKLLGSGQAVIIPAHTPGFIKPKGGFTMILSVINNEAI
jgi:quercetin dioxygenase-like cupin family protein